MLVKFEQNRMVRTTRNLEHFDNKTKQTNKQTKNKNKQKTNKNKTQKQNKTNKKTFFFFNFNHFWQSVYVIFEDVSEAPAEAETIV